MKYRVIKRNDAYWPQYKTIGFFGKEKWHHFNQIALYGIGYPFKFSTIERAKNFIDNAAGDTDKVVYSR